MKRQNQRLSDWWRKTRHAIAWRITPKSLRSMIETAAEFSRLRAHVGWPNGPLQLRQEDARRIARVFGVSDATWRELQAEFYRPSELVRQFCEPSEKLARLLGLDVNFGEEVKIVEFPPEPSRAPELLSALATASRYHLWRRAQAAQESVPMEFSYEYGPAPVKFLRMFASREAMNAAMVSGERVINDYDYETVRSAR